MAEFKEHLWSDLVERHGAALAETDRRLAAQPRRSRRRAVLGATLGLAGVGAAVLLVTSGPGTPPAYAVTVNGDGAVLVTLNQTTALPQADAKLAAMGIHEWITIDMAPGAATVSGPVTCVPQGSNVSGPPVDAIVGTDGTEVIPSNNTGAGTWHLASCELYATGAAGVGGTGNTGTVGGG